MLISRRNLFLKLSRKRYIDIMDWSQHITSVTISSQLFLFIEESCFMQEKLLANAHTQIAQLKANISMKHDEMGTDLVDHLTVEEKKLLLRLNPEITELKEKLVACTTNRIEVCSDPDFLLDVR